MFMICLITLSLQLNDQDLIFVDDREPSQELVEGPTTFELLTNQVANSTQQKDTNDNLKKVVDDENSVQQIMLQKEEHVAPPEKKTLKIFYPPSYPKTPQVSDFCPQTVISNVVEIIFKCFGIT